MKQFVLKTKPDAHAKSRGENLVRLNGGDFHYLVNVRRLAAGDFFPAVLPDGEETLIQIISIENGVLTGKCFPQTKAALPEDSQSGKLPPIILFQAIAKGGKMDLIVRQAAEGGITEIVPFTSEYSAARTESSGEKFLRWERIIKEARQQSGSKIATTIRRPLYKNEIFDYWKKLKEKNGVSLDCAPVTGFLFHHSPIAKDEAGKGLEQESLHSYLNIVPETVVFAIGPEGGFSDLEVALFIDNGFKPVKIGNTVLRTETAALYCAAAIRILLLERDTWEPSQTKKNCG